MACEREELKGEGEGGQAYGSLTIVDMETDNKCNSPEVSNS